jgi:hypothetical protein
VQQLLRLRLLLRWLLLLLLLLLLLRLRLHGCALLRLKRTWCRWRLLVLWQRLLVL